MTSHHSLNVSDFLTQTSLSDTHTRTHTLRHVPKYTAIISFGCYGNPSLRLQTLGGDDTVSVYVYVCLYVGIGILS